MQRRESRPRARAHGTLQGFPHTRSRDGVDGQMEQMEALLQMVEELGGFDTSTDLRAPVAVLSAGSKMESCSAVISERAELSTVTAEMVKFLGYEPLDLPRDDSRRPFLSYWNDTIYPRRYVCLLVEQSRYNLGPILSDFIVLDGDVKDRKVDLVLGKQYLKEATGGTLPLKVGTTSNGQENAQQSSADAQGAWRNTTDLAMNDAAGNTPNLSANITHTGAHTVAPPLAPLGAPLICT